MTFRRNKMLVVVIISGLLFLISGFYLLFGINGIIFSRMVNREVDDLFNVCAGEREDFDLEKLTADLPEPVRKYLRMATNGIDYKAKSARMTHGGEFRLSPDQPWLKIKGEEYFTVCKPGFIWHARLKMLPMVWVEARDKFHNGRGSMYIKLQSTFTVADSKGPEMDLSSYLRWAAEIPWFPQGFLADDYVTWIPVDKRQAKARFEYDSLKGECLFSFDDEGRIIEMQSDDRFREVEGKQVKTRWKGYYSEYREMGGFTIPSCCEVVWVIDGEEFCYARFRIDKMEYSYTGVFSD